MMRSTRTKLRPSGSNNASCTIHTILKTIMVAILMAASYFLGATTALISHVDIQHSDTSNGCISTADVDARVREKVEEELKSQRKQTENDSSIGIASTSAGEESKESIPRFPSTMAGYLAGQARVSRADYLNKFEYGTALDHNMNNNGKKEVFILYHSDRALPLDTESFGHKAAKYQMDEFPIIDVEDATKNCNELNTVVLDVSGGNGRQCTAIIPGYPSWHLQRWGRSNQRGKIDSSLPLRHIGRGLQTNGMDKFGPPSSTLTEDNWEKLKTFLDSVDDVLAELKPILENIVSSRDTSDLPDVNFNSLYLTMKLHIIFLYGTTLDQARKNTIIVMVCNLGQSSLLTNFACNAKSKGLDISSVIVFATDEQTYKLAKGLGLAAFYDEKNFGDLPEKEARG